MSITSKIKALALAAVPLLAVAVAVLVFTWGHSAPTVTEADSSTAPEMHLEVDDAPSGVTCTPDGANPTSCKIATGSSITISIKGDDGTSTADGFGTLVYLDGLKFNPDPGDIDFTPCDIPTSAVNGTGGIGHGCADLPSGTPGWTNQPDIVTMAGIQCNEAGAHKVVLTAELAAGTSPTGGSLFTPGIQIKASQGPQDIDDPTQGAINVNVADVLDVTCNNPTDTPTPTVTNTATNTPTPTNTPAAPPIAKSPDLQNLWLTRQGEKIPPLVCVGAPPNGGEDTASFTVGTDQAVTGVDPKGSGKIQDVGAFEFEVHYDENKICVDIEPGTDADKMICMIKDDNKGDADGSSTADGVARIGCVTQGKPVIVDGVWSIVVDDPIGPFDLECIGAIEEFAAVDAGPFVLPPDKQSMVAGFGSAADSPSIPDCTGLSSEFGWVAHPALGPYTYDNVALHVDGVIPCFEPKTSLCSADGGVSIDFTENALSGVFSIAVGGDPNDVIGSPPTVINGTIVGERIGRIATSDLATVTVRPQPDVYSQAKPNQDNGVVVQLNNQKCALSDLQGHSINVFSCEDADVTIRYLEGDVNPDCTVNSLDTQAIGFRWGAEKGSLYYSAFMNLEPSGAQSDDDIDIKDLQFVYGRFGSGCPPTGVPWPAQEPVNAKQ